ncbi:MULTISPECIES: AbrB/MazE/SpoVT family DNA-binding domain-containing protein [unclassified Campylobacter]|uniref:AbrB/MazE/SpoVT family DNA-binding domain-containing protein n=1 Tax=unclassified Campylobacter TaxID=2593542 RepID=UPI0022E9F009|nr:MULTISPECIES: AbrB/MazE/SpoVT family DNA-binding domain-containing protein [unclassified Campylobacter]MDA3080361.1 AbrB/MazE/SpoVT family DNA-binding domain-containing protein [Campylobacter sp. CS_NA2]MDA3081774.1 AbrB/MazE/SpoVT family DNA-binding domain-containing protein [Campylobacter sp. CS_NA1]MDA3086418.1 AbrB/MazE/SpoVT family DNA-binding domain-containing protein [Campylobacter sp. CS_ED1]MDA3089690.1 AbrB/MazE/SpoVT family DNA-binding domain-containing protein [Campylobacter sp. 
MEATLSKWGNSLAIRIPNYILKKLNLVENSPMNIDVVAGKIVLSKQKNRLETLCSAITEENLNIDDSFDDTKGNEW